MTILYQTSAWFAYFVKTLQSKKIAKSISWPKKEEKNNLLLNNLVISQIMGELGIIWKNVILDLEKFTSQKQTTNIELT